MKITLDDGTVISGSDHQAVLRAAMARKCATKIDLENGCIRTGRFYFTDVRGELSGGKTKADFNLRSDGWYTETWETSDPVHA